MRYLGYAGIVIVHSISFPAHKKSKGSLVVVVVAAVVVVPIVVTVVVAAVPAAVVASPPREPEKHKERLSKHTIKSLAEVTIPVNSIATLCCKCRHSMPC